MGDFNHGNIKCDTLQSTGVGDQTWLCLVQNNFLTQHIILEPTRAARVLDIVLPSQTEFAEYVVIQEPLGSSDHHQLHFKANIYGISSDTHQLQFLKQHHFKLERF